MPATPPRASQLPDRSARNRAATAPPVAPPRPESLIPTQRARRERIVDTAFEFLVHHEYDDIQVRDIAERAEVALGTVYRYFTSKEHLFAAVLVRWGAALRTRVHRAPLGSTDTDGQLRELYLRAIAAFERRPQFFRTLVVIENTTDPNARELWAEFSKVSTDTFMEPLSDFDPEVATAITNSLFPVLHAVLRAWVNGDLEMTVARRRMTDAIDLIFSPPPSTHRSATPARSAGHLGGM